MTTNRSPGGQTHLRPRSTAAVVVSRSDAQSGGGATPRGRVAETATPDTASAWGAVLTWIVLGAAIAALWASLLLGDSLVVSG